MLFSHRILLSLTCWHCITPVLVDGAADLAVAAVPAVNAVEAIGAVLALHWNIVCHSSFLPFLRLILIFSGYKEKRRRAKLNHDY